MNPAASFSTVGDLAEESNLSNAVFITPVFTDDYAMEKTSCFMLEHHDSATLEAAADIIDTPDMNSCSSMMFQSDFICDLAMGDFSCMPSPQLHQQYHAFQDPVSQSLIIPAAHVPVITWPADLLAPVSDDRLFLKETDQSLVACGNDHMSSEEETTRFVATDQMDHSFRKKRMVDETRLQSYGGELQFEQYSDMFAALTADIACGKPKANGAAGTKRRRRPRVNKRELVDLRTMLIQCAEAVGSNDFRNANDFLMQIRYHSSPFGNATQRKAHYFAKALEARLAGTGFEQYAALLCNRSIPSTANIKGRKSLISPCPFMKVSNFFTTETIMKLTKKATTIHIIHFGIPYGLQWSPLIQRLSNIRMLRVTGIDLPQPGSMESSAGRLEATGQYLANCCKQFNIPFEYNGITKKWESISLNDLKVSRNETIVINCLYRLRHVADETADLSSPRDTVLNLVREIHPDIFVHGIVNGSYHAPFFVSRFREALYYFSTMFDMVEEIAPSEDDDEERLLLEENIYGKEILNVVACEGLERIERPETYKQWQVRNLRAGLRQLPLKQEMVKNAKEQVKLQYHRDFLVDEDKNWLLQGWKGRILFALSFWRPN